MKKYIVAMAAAGTMFGMSAAQAADGTITFNGKIKDQSCTISTPAGKDFTVELDTVSVGALAAAGQTAGKKPFTISLSNCPQMDVAAYFEPGNTVDYSNGRLNNQKADGAKNVQVQILKDAKPLAINKNQETQWVKVTQDGNASLDYFGEYYATGAATAGELSTSVMYSIVYQ